MSSTDDLEKALSKVIHPDALGKSFSASYWMMLDPDGIVLRLEEAWEAKLPEALVRPTHWSEAIEIQGKSSTAAIEALLAEARHNGQLTVNPQMVLHLPTLDGLYSPSACPVADGENIMLVFERWDTPAADLLPEMEALYQQALQRLSTTLRSISEGVITTDAEGRIEIFNPEAENITGWDAQTARGKPLAECIYFELEKDGMRLAPPLEEVLSSGLPVGREHGIVLRTQNDARRRVSFNLAPILDASQTVLGTVLILTDITQKVRIENELKKIQRMDSLAMLSAGIAHDFNNFLTTIMGNLSLARSKLEQDHPLYPILSNAERGTQHAKHLTDRLYSFSKASSPLKAPAALNTLLKETAAFILNGSGCKWQLDVSENLWVCDIDEGQMAQVFHNLLINAKQAMTEGGQVFIRARNRNMAWEPSLGLRNGPFLEVIVKDDGCGIEPEHIGKLFEPYFTTKPKGNGIGLATTYSIIKSHEGHIEVDSELGIGTTFTLYLPALPGIKSRNTPVRQAKVQHGEGRILIMDDEQLVQDIAGQMLTHLGYTVAFASNGQMALEAYCEAAEAGQPFDLVLLDLSVAQGSGGVETLKRIQSFDPSVRALLSSGYTHHEEIRHYDHHGFLGAIIKPYNIEQLSWAVRQALAQGS